MTDIIQELQLNAASIKKDSDAQTATADTEYDSNCYHALVVQKGSPRLEICHGNGQSDIFPYLSIGTINCTDDNIITLHCQGSIITITGKNLLRVRNALRDETAQTIRKYSPNIYNNCDEDKPIVTDISVIDSTSEKIENVV